MTERVKKGEKDVGKWQELGSQGIQIESELRIEIERLRSVLVQIDAIGNGLDPKSYRENLTAYSDLMRCGSIARAAPRERRNERPE